MIYYTFQGKTQTFTRLTTVPILYYLVDSNHVSGHGQYSHEHDRITAAHNERCRVYAIATGDSLNIEPSTCAKDNCAGYTKGPLKQENKELLVLCSITYLLDVCQHREMQ